MFIQRACLLLLNSVIAKFFGVLELPGIVAVKVELVIDEVMKAVTEAAAGVLLRASVF